MIGIEQVITEVSKLTNVDRQIVEKVCKHPFRFTTEVMKDEEDLHDILFAKLFKFKLKERFKDNKTKPYSPHKDVTNYEESYNKEDECHEDSSTTQDS